MYLRREETRVLHSRPWSAHGRGRNVAVVVGAWQWAARGRRQRVAVGGPNTIGPYVRRAAPRHVYTLPSQIGRIYATTLFRIVLPFFLFTPLGAHSEARSGIFVKISPGGANSEPNRSYLDPFCEHVTNLQAGGARRPPGCRALRFVFPPHVCIMRL